MKIRSGLVLVLVSGFCAGVAVAGWQWWRAEEMTRAGGFRDARLLVLEAENARLGALLDKRAAERRASEDAVWRDGIAARIARLRELDFIETVVYRSLTREDLPGLIGEKIAEQYSDEELERLSRVYAAMGLLPEGFHLKQAYIDLFAEQIAAFYDQHADALYLFEGTHLEDAANRMILAHELVHALQDQHFQLETLPLETKENDDRVLAAAALVEGDATLSMGLFFAEDAEPGGMVAALASGIFSQSLAALASSPPYLRESLLFPYTKGQEFATALYARGGMQAISDAFRQVPNSTRQVLHPEEYADDAVGFEPAQADWSEPPPDGATTIGVNVLGEFGLRVLLAQWLDKRRAEDAAQGWAGDGYRVSELPEGGHGVEFQSWWDSPDEAREFAGALAEAWSARHGIAGAWSADQAQWSSSADAPRHVRVTVTDSFVRLLDWPSK